MLTNFRIRSRVGRWETGCYLSKDRNCLNAAWAKFRLKVGSAMAQVDPSGLSSQRDVFDAGPVRVICCDGNRVFR